MSHGSTISHHKMLGFLKKAHRDAKSESGGIFERMGQDFKKIAKKVIKKIKDFICRLRGCEDDEPVKEEADSTVKEEADSTC